MLYNGFKREPRELPWFPEWTENANCTPKATGMTLDELDLIFFDHGKKTKLIRKAKAICATCPVIKECYLSNRNIPKGIFFGMTELERWRLNGNKGYPSHNGGSSYFVHFYGKVWNGPKGTEKIANGPHYAPE